MLENQRVLSQVKYMRTSILLPNWLVSQEPANSLSLHCTLSHEPFPRDEYQPYPRFLHVQNAILWPTSAPVVYDGHGRESIAPLKLQLSAISGCFPLGEGNLHRVPKHETHLPIHRAD